MRFWDSSAVLPLIVEEESSERVTAILREDRDLVTWWGTAVECASAVRRRERDGGLNAKETNEALDLLNELTGSWTEILPSNLVRSTAHRMLAVHPLAEADSLQLAAAAAWRRGPTDRAEFVCFDERLLDAAAREGFLCLPRNSAPGKRQIRGNLEGSVPPEFDDSVEDFKPYS